MSTFEKRAWWALLSLVPVYLVYFGVLLAAPSRAATMPEHIALLAGAATIHALLYLTGLAVIRRQDPGDGPRADERDRAIEARATRLAYFALLGGVIVVGMVLPFERSGWQVVDAALFVIVAVEGLRQALILAGYRRPRLAY